ncbi:MAG: glycosyltransferase [Candidatus Marinimicrobia bacterium]|nr:glycosyltransferase [Candidatus Neomarinimicrobiota bacterium]MCF7850489.1 glycosyltransferase [Candidatus Neomarinimicrobiota bacterium]
MSNNITVGIPYHQGTQPEHLRQSIESVLNQTLLPKRLILIQNGDVSEAIRAVALSASSDLVKIDHLFVEAQGLPIALNESIRQTRTKYYARMDSDDIAMPERFALQYNFLESNPDISILGGWAREFSTEEGPAQGSLKEMPTDKNLMHEWFHYRNPFIHSTIMFRMSIFRELGYYDERFTTDQDLQLWGRAIKHGTGIANIPEALIYFRTDNMLAKRSRLDAVWRQIKARYAVWTPSIRLNILKIAALFFRLTPKSFRAMGYKYFR